MAELIRLSGVFQTRIDALTDGIPGLALGNADAIHRTRVATRRLREVLPIAITDHNTARDLRRRLRDVNRILGPIRELDVLSQLLAELQPESRYSTAAVATAVTRARKGVGRRLESSARKLAKLAWRLNDAAAELESGASRNPRKVGRTCRWAIQARAIKRASRVRSAMDHAGVLYASGPLHEVRVSIKKLRYAIELSDEVLEAQPGVVTALKDIQDLLGRQHDLEILQEWGRQVQLSMPHRSSWRELAALIRSLESDCRELHARYIRKRPALTALMSRVSPSHDWITIDDRFAAG